MTNNINYLAKVIVVIIFLFQSTFTYAETTGYTGIWTDNNNNYFSIQVENGKALLIDLSRSLPRAEELERIGVEPRVEYLSHYGDATPSLEGYTLFLWPIVDLKDTFPEITRDVMDQPIRIRAATFSLDEANLYNLCLTCSGDSSFDRTLYKVW